MKSRTPGLIAAFTIASAVALMAPADALAQRQFPGQAPDTWATVYGMMYTNISGMPDPGSDTHWVFDDAAFGFGASLQRQFGQSLRLGVDGSLARPKFEMRDLDTEVVLEDGTASIATLMATGRYGYGGGSNIGLYLAGGIGTVAYKLADLSWNPDFALQAGTGLEYRFGGSKAIALEWGRTWGYHEKEGLGGGNQAHSALRLALRFGF
jgi:opacity protein-like surface antigen